MITYIFAIYLDELSAQLGTTREGEDCGKYGCESRWYVCLVTSSVPFNTLIFAVIIYFCIRNCF